MSVSLATLQVGRLLLGPPPSTAPITEPVGDPLATVGGTVAAGQRTAPAFQIALATYLTGGTTVAQGQTLRRQLRCMLNNTPVKLQGYLYVVYTDDTEQNGWYAPDQTTIAGVDAWSWKSDGLWQSAQGAWYRLGTRRANREARQLWVKDLRSGLYWRDAQRWIYSTDFAALPALALPVLPNGALAGSAFAQQQLSVVALPAGRDGGACSQIQGLSVSSSDLTVVSYERGESALNLSDVIVYDRRGNVGPFGAGGVYDSSAGLLNPQSAYGWEEVYGPDYPWSWLNQGGTNDVPVVENGLVRVRYDAANTPGFRVDAWNGSTYVEQGKMCVQRIGDSVGFCNTWESAQLMEWTPDRAVVSCALANSADPFSRERVFVTVQRGEYGVTFECYPALKQAAGQADAALYWTPALNNGAADLNLSVCKIDSQGAYVSGVWGPGAAGSAVYAATAGTGAGAGESGEFPSGLATLGNANFTTSENWVALLRCPTGYSTVAPYQTVLCAVQAAGALAKYQGSSTTAYGAPQNAVGISSQSGAGYVQAQVCFGVTQAQQVLEAESMTLGTNSTVVNDSTASGGSAVKNTQNTGANAVVAQASWPNSFSAVYRCFARVKVNAGTGTFYVTTGATTGQHVTTVSTSWTWIDLGEVASNGTLSLYGWNPTTSDYVEIDRFEAVLVSDSVRSSAIYSGSRDAGQAALSDTRAQGALVARA